MTAEQAAKRLFRRRGRETEDYPGLVVCDNRVSGSITAGRSRLPLWALTGTLSANGWAGVEENWEDTHGLTNETFFEFVHHLLESRRSFGRLLSILADVARREDERRERVDWPFWRDHKPSVRRVKKVLEECLRELEEGR